MYLVYINAAINQTLHIRYDYFKTDIIKATDPRRTKKD